MSSRRLEALKRRLASLTPEELAEVLGNRSERIPAGPEEPVRFVPFSEAGFPPTTRQEPKRDSVAYQRALRDEWPD